MSELKTLKIFNDGLEAEFAQNSLKSIGIESFIRGSKEYASHVLGGETGRYELLVNMDDLEQAKIHLDGPKLTIADSSLAEEPSTQKSTYLKKAVLFSFYASVFLPVIFNYFAIQNLIKYRAVETSSLRRNGFTALVFLLQIPILIYSYLILEKFL